MYLLYHCNCNIFEGKISHTHLIASPPIAHQGTQLFANVHPPTWALQEKWAAVSRSVHVLWQLEQQCEQYFLVLLQKLRLGWQLEPHMFNNWITHNKKDNTRDHSFPYAFCYYLCHRLTIPVQSPQQLHQQFSSDF